jgi:hypothetical protein
MAEHLLVKEAYAAVSLRKGKLEREVLLPIGARSGGIDDLEGKIISSWLDKNGLVSGRPVDRKRLSTLMTFPNKEEWEGSTIWGKR